MARPIHAAAALALTEATRTEPAGSRASQLSQRVLMRYIVVFLSWTLVVLPVYGQQAQSQQKISMYQIRDNFIAVAVVYNKCGSNDSDLKLKFGTNLQAISIRAAMQAREEHPDQPDAVLAKAMQDRLDAVVALTTKALGLAGCNSDYARKMLKLYEFHANWNMYARPNP